MRTTERWVAARHARRRGLLGELVDVVADLPLFVTSSLYRRWHVRWGSTSDEVASAMPGDATLPMAKFVATRAIAIDAEPAKVWPWLVQVGCGRAGSYSNDLLDNLGRPSATTNVPVAEGIGPSLVIALHRPLNPIECVSKNAPE